MAKQPYVDTAKKTKMGMKCKYCNAMHVVQHERWDAVLGAFAKKTYYHVTELSNLDSIVCNGLELRNMEKLVYLCEKPEDCLKFALVHGMQGEVLVLTVELDEADVIETFDHSEAFFKCRCWGSTKAIPTFKIIEYKKYTIGNGK
jgi:hypothetical protein